MANKLHFTLPISGGVFIDKPVNDTGGRVE
jgi:hypothetical protein